MARQRDRRNISRNKVYKYWEENTDKLGPLPSGICAIWSDSCFACGNNRYLEVCHIVPRVFGGSDDASNLHILCKRCHGESEALKAYWLWLRWKRFNEWQSYQYHLYDLVKKCEIPLDTATIFLMTPEENIRYVKNIMNQLFWLCDENSLNYIPGQP